MIFISGVHGVGKSYFCEKVRTELSIDTYSASKLIAERKNMGFSNDKLISDIEDNQPYLLSAVQELSANGTHYLIDGHFCLLDAMGKVTRIPKDTFTSLNPEAIIILTEKPAVVATRLKQRDGIDHEADDIQRFQDEEITYAKEISKLLTIPIKVSTGAHDINDTLDFVQAIMRRAKDGG